MYLITYLSISEFSLV